MLTHRKCLRLAVLPTLVVMICAQGLWAQREQGGNRQQRGQRGSRQGGQSRFGGGFGGFGGFGGGGMNKTALLGRLKDKEGKDNILKITAAQKKKLDDLSEQRRSEMRDLFSSLRDFRDLPEDEREKKMADLRKRGEEAGKKQLAVLTAKQQQRLSEILYQVLGVRALLQEDVAKELELTEAQQADIKKLLNPPRDENRGANGRDRFAQLREAQGEEREKLLQQLREEMTKLREEQTKKRKENEAKALKVLTAIQGDLFELMQGDKLSTEVVTSLTSRNRSRGGNTRSRGGQGGGRGNRSGGGRPTRPSRPGNDQ